MTRRELAAWLIVAFMAGSAVTPHRVEADYYTSNSNALYAIRNAIARICELEASNDIINHRYDARRCWR